MDESYSFYPYELILPCTADDARLYDDFTDLPPTEGRIVAGFDVGRTRDRPELAVFEQLGDRFWAVALACQKERGPSRSGTEIGIRVLG